MILLGMQRVIVASDAAQDEPRQGSAGSLVVDGDGHRFAYVREVTEALFCLWLLQLIFVANQASGGLTTLQRSWRL